MARLVGPVLPALGDGTAILMDELDASLHLLLAEQIVALFQNGDTNTRCAQLIFNAHDATVLGDSGQRLLGRDRSGSPRRPRTGQPLSIPLSDFRPKADEAIGRRYLLGRYGAVPVLDPAGFRKAADSSES